MNKWVGVTFFLALAGCAGMQEQQTVVDDVEVKSSAPVVTAIPKTAIDENLLYLLMAAELAGQREQYALALDAYLQAAKRVVDARVAERAVKIAMFLKDRKRTQEAISIWLEKDTHNLMARKFAALDALREGNKKDAVEHLDVILSLDPAGFEDTMLEMGKMLDKARQTEFVYEVLDELIPRHPNSAAIYFLQAMLASTQQKPELAQEKITQALQLQPGWSKAVVLQAQLAGRAGDMQKARDYLEKALKQNPADERIRKIFLELLVDQGDYNRAIELYLDVLEKKPDDGESQFAIALIYLQQNQPNKAQNYLEQLLDNPEWALQASFYLGRIEFDQQHFDRALAFFDRVDQGPYAFEAASSSVSLLMRQKHYAEAESRIKHLGDKYPDQRLRVLLMKAELYNELKQYQESFDVLSVALTDAADNRDLLYARALVAERLGKLDVLEADLKRILEKKPDDVGALNALGYSLVDRTNRYSEAEKYLQQALAIQPEEAVIIDSYGWLQFKLGNAEVALSYLKRAYDKQAENEIAAHVAEVLWFLGREVEAKEVFRKAIKSAPDDEYLLEFKRRFLDGGD